MRWTALARRRLTRRAALLGGSAALLGGLWACSNGGNVPGKPSAPTGAFIEVDGTRLHYRVMGDGPPAVVIHGASGNLRDWTMGPAVELAKTNRLLLIDRPGLGFSDRPSRAYSSPFVQARLMRAAAGQLGFERSLLIGHSFGGSVALAWALDAPETVRGLMALAAPSQVWPGGVDAVYHLTGQPVIGDIATRVLPGFVGPERVQQAITNVFAPQDPPEGYMEGIGVDLALRPATLRANGQDILALKEHVRGMVPRYPSLSIPVELLHGTSDTIVPNYIHSEKLVEQLPDARHTPLLGVGHMPHHVALDQIATALKRLNARVGRR